MRLGFLGSPPFALPVFEHLAASSHEICLLVTRPDRPRGRGRSLQISPLVQRANELGIPVLQPSNAKSDEFAQEVASFEPEVLVVASYGVILLENVLSLARCGALNVHASLLPRWRGASPIQAAILAGDEETGVSIQRMVLALDEGDVMHEERTRIGRAESAGELVVRLAELGGVGIVRALDKLEAGEATFVAQDPERVTYAKKLSKSDGRLDWAQPATELDRRIRAMTPWPGARSELEDGRGLVILEAALRDPGGEAAPGTLLDEKGRFVVACGEGSLELLSVKPAGKGAMDGAAFLRGARLSPGDRLS